MANMWKDIYGALDLDFVLFVIKYDDAYLKLDLSYRQNNLIKEENPKEL